MEKLSSSNGIEKYPKLRFPGFSEPWQFNTAKVLFENIVDKNHPEDTVLTIMQGAGTLPRGESSRNIRYDESGISNYKRVMPNDYIIHLRSFEGGLEMANTQGIISPAYTVLRPKNKVAPLFYDAYFHTDEFINHILAKSVEGIRDGRQISYDAFKWLKIPTCFYDEQYKIAELFRILSVRIKKQQELVERLKKYKRGVLRKVFDDINCSCAKSSLEDLCISISSGKTTSVKDGGKYPLIGSTGPIGYTDIEEFNEELILVARVGANAGTVNYYAGSCGVTDNTLVVRVDKTSNNPKYILNFLEYYDPHRLIFGSGQPLVTGGQLKKIEVPIISMELQEKVVELFSLLNRYCVNAQHQLDLLICEKKALLQQLFI